MAITLEQSAQRNPESGGGSAWLVIGTVLLILTVVGYVFVLRLIDSTETKIETKNAALVAGAQGPDKEIQDKVLAYQAKVRDLSELLAGHLMPSKFMETLEKLSHPDIIFTKLSFDQVRSQVNLEGLAKDMTSLSQQYNLLAKQVGFNGVMLNRSQLSQLGQLVFEVSFNVDKNLMAP